jgi:hypothetical protein
MQDSSSQSQADHVINKFGGINACARACGHKNASTVQGWKERGWIPQERQPEVIEAGRAAGVKLTAEDFIHHLREAEGRQVDAA